MGVLYCIDGEGNYLGAYADGAVPPAEAVEVAMAPNHALDKYVNGAWIPYLGGRARAALVWSDSVANRAWKEGNSYPQTWRDFDDGMRAVINNETTTLPQIPSAFPNGDSTDGIMPY